MIAPSLFTLLAPFFAFSFGPFLGFWSSFEAAGRNGILAFAGGGVELPFGGVKSSGYGREKGFEALYGFSVLKTVVVRHGW